MNYICSVSNTPSATKKTGVRASHMPINSWSAYKSKISILHNIGIHDHPQYIEDARYFILSTISQLQTILFTLVRNKLELNGIYTDNKHAWYIQTIGLEYK